MCPWTVFENKCRLPLPGQLERRIYPPSLWRQNGQKCVLALPELLVAEIEKKRRSSQSFPEKEKSCTAEKHLQIFQFLSKRNIACCRHEVKRPNQELRNHDGSPFCEGDLSHLRPVPVLPCSCRKERYVRELSNMYVAEVVQTPGGFSLSHSARPAFTEMWQKSRQELEIEKRKRRREKKPQRNSILRESKVSLWLHDQTLWAAKSYRETEV